MANEKRLIDANEVERKLRIAISSWHRDCNSNAPVIARAMEDALQRVIYASTVDAVEVVHGRWEWYTDRCEDLFLGCDDDYGWRCNHCKTPLEDCDDPEMPPAFNYCPNCGTKMDGDGNA